MQKSKAMPTIHALQLAMQQCKKKVGITKKGINPHPSQLLCHPSSRGWHGFGILTRADGSQKPAYHHPLHWPMCGTPPIHQASDREPAHKVQVNNSIGDLFRDYGDQYINIYKPSHQQIKLIRAIRVCKTPALSGTIIHCNNCGHKHYVYHSCGHSHYDMSKYKTGTVGG
ncbi:MAG: transposase zinc-binding domain-containing protein [Saprospiraceae bacterium]|nr:transposase zinc-binding domain-containing protein [Saprospiraceae bacterium]